MRAGGRREAAKGRVIQSKPPVLGMREGLNVFQAFDREVNEGEYAPEGETGRLDINWPEDEAFRVLFGN